MMMVCSLIILLIQNNRFLDKKNDLVDNKNDLDNLGICG